MTVPDDQRIIHFTEREFLEILGPCKLKTRDRSAKSGLIGEDYASLRRS